MKRVKILGAGLSGMTAAINLAKEGYDVKIFEKSSDCGKRFNGDFQGFENNPNHRDALEDLKSMNIKINFYYEPFYKSKIYTPNLRNAEMSNKKPIFYLVRRGSAKDCLDMALKRQAMKLGVDIEFNKRVSEDKVDIIATGPKRVSILASGITFKTRMKKYSINMIDDSIAPKGYAYLLIHKGRGTLATVLVKDAKNIETYLERTIKTFQSISSFDMRDVRHFSGYGNFFFPKKYEKNGKLLVGESAGLQDFLAGFGMRYAITSGYLAARSIIEKKSYDRLIKKSLVGQIKSSLANRILFEKLGNAGYNLSLGKSLSNRAFNFMESDYSKSVLKMLIYNFFNLSEKLHNNSKDGFSLKK